MSQTQIRIYCFYQHVTEIVLVTKKQIYSFPLDPSNRIFRRFSTSKHHNFTMEGSNDNRACGDENEGSAYKETFGKPMTPKTDCFASARQGIQNSKIRLSVPLGKSQVRKNLFGKLEEKENDCRKAVHNLSIGSPSSGLEPTSFKRSRLSEIPSGPLRAITFKNHPEHACPNFFLKEKQPELESFKGRHVRLMQAVEQSDRDPLLIGDCSSRYFLPILEDGKQSDLKGISGLTLSKLLSGEYGQTVNRFEIIDCRYPYEYIGGHIKGALNLHTQKQVQDKYMKSKTAKTSTLDSKDHVILIFHCEFSVHRGPNMCRFLRGADRQCNEDCFPSLHYPEMYLLKGGYKLFFENHQEHCVPIHYTPMLDPQNSENLILYKKQSKNELAKASSAKQLKKSGKSFAISRLSFD